ncbi:MULTISPECIES: hypothetical protein [unclassified Crossiella]|uniref:hypothetical protein n=1 Tax=unclassified Crossiella TaxID=2620835 RepID=UPI001FFF6C3D|nr:MULTISPECIES: hypothetical protein [unclassified Crossiella]MCK2243673.1 hypothetical protein [Crossiella sp. S99.2]MCK2257532.1 hypothetical protein [Crossiella sp. S99.1]
MRFRPSVPTRYRAARRWLLRSVTVAACAVFTWMSMAAPALAAPPGDLNQVIERIRLALLVLGGALVGLFITIGFFRYSAADGDPGETERAKKAIRCAAVGFLGAAIAQLIVKVLQSVVS